MSERDGGPAFPSFVEVEEYSESRHQYVTRRVSVGGMSLRDYFAGQVLSGVYASNSQRLVASGIADEAAEQALAMSPRDVAHFTTERIAAMVYEMADAMLDERMRGRGATREE